MAMKRTAVSLFALLSLVACGNKRGDAPQPVEPVAKAPPTTAPAAKKKATPAGVVKGDGKLPGKNVIEEVRKMNSSEFGAPSAKFRAGHVSKHKAPKIKKTAYGYEVQFASHAPVVTPTIYQGKVMVSGGFRSKEFHALAMNTGKSAWSISLDDDGPSTAACEDGVCVFNTESCTIFAVDAETGKKKWAWWLGDPLTSTPAVANGIVFTSYPATGTAGNKPRPAGATHVLAAFDLHTGKVLWQRWLDSDVMSSPVATDGFVYVATFAGTVMKLEQKTGKFRYAVRARATSTPVVQFHDGTESMYYTSRADRKSADPAAPAVAPAEEQIIRTDHNEPKTKFKAARKKADYLDKKAQASSHYAAESADDDAANGFGGGAPSSANAQAAAGNVGAANVSSMQSFQGSRILHMRGRNVNTMGDEVIATSSETGEKLWSYKLKGDVAKAGGFLGTAPLAAGHSVIMATLKGNVLVLDPETGKARAEYKVGAQIRAQPVVANGWIYVGTTDGRLVAINTHDAGLTGWPTWGGNAARTGIPVAHE